MENSFFGLLLLKIMDIVQNSALARFVQHVLVAFSRIWEKSAFHLIFFESKFKWDIEQSLVYRIFISPFTFLNYLSRRYPFNAVKESCVLHVIRCYLEYILQMNTRFFGGFLLVVSICYTASRGGVNAIGITCIVIAFLGILLNLEGRRVLANSFLFTTCLKGIDMGWTVTEPKVDNRQSMLYGTAVGTLAGALLISTTPFKMLLIIVGLTTCFFVFYKPIYGLFLTILLAPILPTTVMVLVCGLVAVSVIVRNLLDETHEWRLDDMGFLLMTLLAVYVVGVIVSFTRMSSLPIFMLYLVFIGFYIIMTQLLIDKHTVFTAIKLFVLSGTVVAIYGILQYVFGWGENQNWIDPNVFTTLTKRAYSTLENPNILGEYLILTIMISTGLTVTRDNWLARIGYAGCTGIMLGCLLATYSRGCWLGMGLAVAIFITFYNGKLWLLSIPALLVAPLVLPENVITRFTSIGNMEDTSTAIRVKIWLSSLGMGTDFMLTGLGLGAAAYAFAYPFYAYYYIPANHSHNVFFQMLIEGGIVGVFLFIAILYRFLKHMTLTYQREHTKDKTVAYTVLALAAGVIGFLVQGMFDYSFYNYRMVLIFWMFVCFGRALARVSEQENV